VLSKLTLDVHPYEQLLHLFQLRGRVIGAAHQNSAGAGRRRHTHVGHGRGREGPRHQDVAFVEQQGAQRAHRQAQAPVLRDNIKRQAGVEDGLL